MAYLRENQPHKLGNLVVPKTPTRTIWASAKSGGERGIPDGDCLRYFNCTCFEGALLEIGKLYKLELVIYIELWHYGPRSGEGFAMLKKNMKK